MFRFTIRDVLWLTALVALSAAWWADRTRLHQIATGATHKLWIISADTLGRRVSLQPGGVAVVEMNDNGEVAVRRAEPNP